MKTPRLRTQMPVARPFWVRVTALLAVVAMFVFGTAQATHKHGQWLPESKAKVQAPSEAGQQSADEQHCGLCAAAVTTLPAAEHVVPVAVVVALPGHAAVEESARTRRGDYDLFSRPPPRNSFAA